MSFPEQLKKARLAKGYTQQQVADIMGITNSTYCGYETGKREPDVPKIKKLAALLGVSGDDLLELSPPDASPQYNTYLTPHQQQVITAYINHPELHLAIDKLLGVEPERSITPEMIEQLRINPNEDRVKIAAYGGGVREEKIAPEKIQEAKRLAMEIMERKKKEKKGE